MLTRPTHRPTRSGVELEYDFIQIPRAVLADERLSHAAKIVYGRLRLYSGKDGKCCPRHETLAKEVCMGMRQLREVLPQLREAGWISWTRSRSGCIYVINETCGNPHSRVALSRSSRVAEIRSSRVAENCLQKRSIENHHQKRSLEKNEGKPEQQNQKLFDDEKPKPVSPEVELRQVYYEKTGFQITPELERKIWESVELRSITRLEFITQLRDHVPNNWRNPAGLLIALARKIGAAPVVEEPLVVTPEPERNEKGKCVGCNGIGYLHYEEDHSNRKYCECSLGRGLKTVDGRLKLELLMKQEAGKAVITTKSEKAIG